MSAAPMNIPVSDAGRELLAPLAALRSRCRLYVVIGGLLQLSLAIVAASILQFVLDRWLRFTTDQRAFLNGAITLFWLWVVHRYFVLPLARPLPDDVLARWIDARHPELHENIAIATQFAAGQVGIPDSNSRQLIDAVIREACAAARQISFLSVLDHSRARRQSAALLGVALVVAGAFQLPVVSDLVHTWFARNWLLQDIPWPQKTYIFPEGFEAGRKRVPIGDELQISARIDGAPSDTAQLLWWTDTGRRGEEPMTLRGATRWEVSLGVLTETIHFRIVGGDERTREYVVEAVDRPHVVKTIARIAAPAYTNLPPAVLEQQTVLEILRGASVEIEAWVNKPIATAQFVGPDGFAIPCETVAAERVLARLATVPTSGTAAPPESAPAAGGLGPGRATASGVVNSGGYHFELRDRDGLTDRRPIRFTIKVVADRPPNVELKPSGIGELVTPIAELPLDLRFDDAYGLRRVGLSVQRAETEPQDVPLPDANQLEREYRAHVVVPLAPLKPQPGERVRLVAEATDTDPVGPNTGRAPPLELRVVSIEDFLSDLARREMELRREFERLMSEQRVYGDALDRVLTGLADSSAATAAAQQLTALARRQAAQATRCLAIRKQFEQILAEMRTSKVAKASEERRLNDLIIAPLGELANDVMPAVAEQVAALRTDRSDQRVGKVRDGQAEILRRMRSILANMLEWEGYREAVALLREIIASQTDLRNETVQAVEKQLEAILGDDPADGKKK